MILRVISIQSEGNQEVWRFQIEGIPTDFCTYNPIGTRIEDIISRLEALDQRHSYKKDNRIGHFELKQGKARKLLPAEEREAEIVDLKDRVSKLEKKL